MIEVLQKELEKIRKDVWSNEKDEDLTFTVNLLIASNDEDVNATSKAVLIKINNKKEGNTLSVTKITYLSAARDVVFKDYPVEEPKIVAVLPAHNEEKDIGNTLRSLALQALPKGVRLHVYIALDNCTDHTEKVIREVNKELGLTIFLLETVNNQERKVGALNQIYQLFYGNLTHLRSKEVGPNQSLYASSIEAFLGIDADVYLEKGCLLTLWEELHQTHYIGSVSANYTCLIPLNRKEIAEEGLPAERGSFLNRWWASQQIRDFADWTMRQKQNGHQAEIAGGQCTLFRPSALLDVRESYKLNGFYDNKTDTEDLLLTQYIRACGWKAMVSGSARCYVDSMNTYPTYFAQRKKWVSGTTDYMMMDGLRTKYARQLWAQELGLFLNLFIRILLVLLVTISITLDSFEWNWIWLFPFVLSSVLNTLLTLRSPSYRWYDFVLCFLGINPEIYLWITLRIHLSVWVSKLKVTKVDGWANQYSAERGENGNSRLATPLILLALVSLVFYILRDKLMLTEGLRQLGRSFIMVGYPFLSVLTILMSLVILRKIVLLRYPHQP